MKIRSHSLSSFVQRTDTPYKNLQKLITQYPEDALQPDDKIFNRILTNDWRYLKNDFTGPVEKRYADASKWVEALHSYHSDLCDFCKYSLGAAQKLDELPMHPNLRLSASQCLDHLKLQFQVLTRWESEAKASASADHLSRLRTDLQALIQTRGMKTVKVEAGLSRDTIQDFTSGKTKVQEKTLQILETYVKQQKCRIDRRCCTNTVRRNSDHSDRVVSNLLLRPPKSLLISPQNTVSPCSRLLGKLFLRPAEKSADGGS
jgi:hypothetical protein